MESKLIFVSFFFFFADPKNDPIRDSKPWYDLNCEFCDLLHPWWELIPPDWPVFVLIYKHIYVVTASVSTIWILINNYFY